MKPEQVKKFLKVAADECHKRGARLTPQRAHVLELLASAQRPMTAYDLLDMMNAEGGKVAPPTVYRALEFLLDQHLIHRLETLHAFVPCDDPEHEHSSQFFICGDCGDVQEVEDRGLRQSLAKAEAELGFHARRPVVEVLGTCASCSDPKDIVEAGESTAPQD